MRPSHRVAVIDRKVAFKWRDDMGKPEQCVPLMLFLGFVSE